MRSKKRNNNGLKIFVSILAILVIGILRVYLLDLCKYEGRWIRHTCRSWNLSDTNTTGTVTIPLRDEERDHAEQWPLRNSWKPAVVSILLLGVDTGPPAQNKAVPFWWSSQSIHTKTTLEHPARYVPPKSSVTALRTKSTTLMHLAAPLCRSILCSRCWYPYRFHDGQHGRHPGNRRWVGGITIESPPTFNQNGYDFVKARTSGEALVFARMRYEDPAGDTGRQDERLVIEAVIRNWRHLEHCWIIQTILQSPINPTCRRVQLFEFYI